MAILVTVRWRTPAPTAVDERLVVTDDGRGRLEVVRPRVGPEVVGVFAGAVEPSEVEALTALGPEVELNVTVADPQAAALGTVAASVADRLRGTPLAAAAFFVRPYGEPAAGQVMLALGVVGHGTQPVEFELEPAECAVHFLADGAPVSWAPLPHLPIGFMTPDAEGLGGVRGRAEVPPDVLGAISVELAVPEGADQVSAQLAGRLFLAGADTPEAFVARTPPAAIAVASA
jgi:hypothetical protein